MKALIWYVDGGPRLAGDVALVERWRADPRALLWLDLSPDDGDDEAHWLAHFGADETTLSQALSARFPPKIEHTGAGTFILLRALNAEAQSIQFDTIQIAFLVGERSLVSRHSGHSPSIERTSSALLDVATTGLLLGFRRNRWL